MEIIGHRGNWKTGHSPNSIAAISCALQAGFGAEFDVRDHGGELVIEHDIPLKMDQPPLLSEVLSLHKNHKGFLAVDIKSAGLLPMLTDAMKEVPIDRWAAFDLSTPELVTAKKLGIPYLIRTGPLDPVSALWETASGILVDAWGTDWFDFGLIKKMAAAGKLIHVISNEIHASSPREQWEKIRWLEARNPKIKIHLITDLIDEATFGP